MFRAIIRRWKTYNRFLKEQSLPLNFELKWNKETCKRNFMDLAKKLNKVPAVKDLRKFNNGLLAGILLNYKKFNKFLAELGFALHRESWDKEKCIKRFKKIMKNRDLPPTTEELVIIDPKLRHAIFRHFKSYNKVLKKLAYKQHYGMYDWKWKVWEKFVIKVCKEIYDGVLIKPTLKNRSWPDVVVLKNNSFDKIIDAKLNAFCYSIKEDIEKYKNYSNKLEFWCMFRDRKLEIENVKIVHRKDIKRILQNKGRKDLVHELEALEYKCCGKLLF